MNEPAEVTESADRQEGNAEAPHRRSRLAPLVRSIINILAVAYLLALLAVVVGLRFIGERWWVTTIALYLPRIGFALPLPFLVVALLVSRSYRLLITQAAAVIILLFPLMGLHLGGSRAASAGALRFRIFSLNIGLGSGGTAEILDRIRGVDPDVIVLVEASEESARSLRSGLPSYSFRNLDQFVIASRFPIEQAAIPPAISINGEPHSAHYARCRLITPAGPIRLFAVHPISPHDAFDELRGEGLRDEILSGRIVDSRSGQAMGNNTRRRMAQVQALAADADASPERVIIAGDTNLPGLSWAFGHWLGDYQDGFAETGRGFGYSYPAHKKVWMRIDRVLAGSRFRFLSASTVSPRISDHLAVTADLEMLPGPP